MPYKRLNRDIDPHLVWCGKDEQDWSNFVVPAPPLYIQENVHPKMLIHDMRRPNRSRAASTDHRTLLIFSALWDLLRLRRFG